MSKSEQTKPARVSDGAQMPLFDNKALHHQSHGNESGLTSAAGGVVLEGWQVKRLGDLAIVSAGGTPSRGNANYWGGDIPWLTTSEVDFGTISEAQQFITNEGLRNSAAKLLPPGTLLLALYGQGKTRGKVAILGIQAATNQACAAISLSRGVSPEFIFHLLASQYEAIRKLSNTGNQENLNGSLVRSISLQLPGIHEQTAIAVALSDADALLGALDRLIAKKRDLKQAAMQQLLTGQTRLPGFKDVWGVSTVGREFEIKLGKMLDAERNIGVPKPFLGNRAVQWGRIDIRDLSTVPMSPSDIAAFGLRRGDLLVCEGGEVGRAAIWDAPIAECYYQKALHRLRPIADFDPRLMAAFLRLWADRGVLANYVTQTSIAHLPREKFLEITLPVPPPAEQAAIADLLSEMDAELTALEQRRDKTRALKQGMMQELLTGRIRLV